MEAINLREKFGLFGEHWTPKILAEVNGQLVKIAKGLGEIVWHAHANEDELFLILKGRLIIRFRDHEVALGLERCSLCRKAWSMRPMQRKKLTFC